MAGKAQNPIVWGAGGAFIAWLLFHCKTPATPQVQQGGGGASPMGFTGPLPTGFVPPFAGPPAPPPVIGQPPFAAIPGPPFPTVANPQVTFSPPGPTFPLGVHTPGAVIAMAPPGTSTK